MGHGDGRDGTMVFLLTGLGVGGAERQAVRLATRLVARGRDVRVVSMIDPIAHVETLERAGVPVESLGMARGRADVSAFMRLVRLLKDLRPRTLLCFMYHANLMGRLAGRVAGVPRIVVSVRIEKFGGFTREWAFRLSNGLSAATVVNSQLAADSLVRRRVVARDQLLVIPNGIDFAEIDAAGPATRSDLGIPEAAFLWIAVGRFDPQKDHASLLEAFGATGREADHLLLVGDGPLRPDAERRAADAGLSDRVHFTGVRDDVPALLGLADALVMSSLFEGLPNVLIEAHTAGLPVVATDVGGVREVVVPDGSGYVVPAGDLGGLARALRRLAETDPDARREMGRTGREHVESRFEIGRVVDRWDRVLFPDAEAGR